MTPREIFHKACGKISGSFVDRGFQATQKGQCLKKISKDKDLIFEIYFRSSAFNHASSIAIYPLISVYSKSLKKWMRQQTGNIHEPGIVYQNHIGYLSPLDSYKSWELAGLSLDVSVRDITKLLEQYALPIFDLFEDKERALDFIEQQGCCFYSYAHNSLAALPYVFLHGGKEKAEIYFNTYLQTGKCRNRFLTAFREWEKGGKADLGVDSPMAVFAFTKGLKIN